MKMSKICLAYLALQYVHNHSRCTWGTPRYPFHGWNPLLVTHLMTLDHRPISLYCYETLCVRIASHKIEIVHATFHDEWRHCLDCLTWHVSKHFCHRMLRQTTHKSHSNFSSFYASESAARMHHAKRWWKSFRIKIEKALPANFWALSKRTFPEAYLPKACL